MTLTDIKIPISGTNFSSTASSDVVEGCSWFDPFIFSSLTEGAPHVDTSLSVSGWPESKFERLENIKIVTLLVISSPPSGEAPTTGVCSGTLQKLHSELGLTWDQIARYFGVSRRSVHSWVNGGRISAANEEAILETAELLEQLAFVELNPDERRAELLRQMQARRAERERNSEEDINRPAITWAEA